MGTALKVTNVVGPERRKSKARLKRVAQLTKPMARPKYMTNNVAEVTRPYWNQPISGICYDTVWELAEAIIPGVYCHDKLSKRNFYKMSREQNFHLRSLDKLELRMLDWARHVDYNQADPEFREFAEDVDYVQHGQKLLFKRAVQIFSKVDKQKCNELYKKYWLPIKVHHSYTK